MQQRHDIANLTIEHIYPQASTDAKWTPEIVGSLGNLIFLTQKDNGSLKNDDFKKKIQSYMTFKGSVPEDVLSATDWTIDRVQARTKMLAEISYNEIWKIK